MELKEDDSELLGPWMMTMASSGALAAILVSDTDDVPRLTVSATFKGTTAMFSKGPKVIMHCCSCIRARMA